MAVTVNNGDGRQLAQAATQTGGGVVVNVHLQPEEKKRAEEYARSYLHIIAEVGAGMLSASYFPSAYILGVASGSFLAANRITRQGGMGSGMTPMESTAKMVSKIPLSEHLLFLGALFGTQCVANRTGAGGLLAFGLGARHSYDAIHQMGRLVTTEKSK